MHRDDLFVFGKNAGFDRFFLWSIFSYYVISFLLPYPNQFFIRVLPLVLGFAIYVVSLFFIKIKLSNSSSLALSFLVAFSFLASSYLFLQFGFKGFLSMESLFFLSLPLFFIAASRLNSEQGLIFIYKFFFYFLSFQLFVMIGQGMKMLTGIGFSTPAEFSEVVDQANYANMLSGTFMNANDLASLSVMIAVVFLLLKHYRCQQVGAGLAIIFIILLLTVSRTAIILYMTSLLFFWLYSKRLNLSKIFILLVVYLPLFIMMLMVIYSVIDTYSGNIEAIGRIKLRLDTIYLVLDGGISADHSMSIRYESYLNFLNNLTHLGYGTAKFRDYSEFVHQLGSRFDLLAINPHSFIVEIGYWLGWLGLTLFSVFLLAAFYVNKRWLFLYPLIVFLMASMISSSVINNFFFFITFFVMSFISFPSSRKNNHRRVVYAQNFIF